MTYGVKDICERYKVGEHTVLAWIRSGKLHAVNVGRKLGGKKKWRITEDALRAFEVLRAPTPELPKSRRCRQAAGVIEFYK